jgi:hypothetical protein
VVVTADLVDELALQVASERATAFRIAGAPAAAELARQVAGEIARQVAGELARQVAGEPVRTAIAPRPSSTTRAAELELDPPGRRCGRARRCRGSRSRARR